MFQRIDIAAQTDCMIVQQMWDKCIQLDHGDDASRSNTMRYDKDTHTQESFTSINKFLTEFQDGIVQKLENNFVKSVDKFARTPNETAILQNQMRMRLLKSTDTETEGGSSF